MPVSGLETLHLPSPIHVLSQIATIYDWVARRKRPSKNSPLLQSFCGEKGREKKNPPWHEILHVWQIDIKQQLECNGFKSCGNKDILPNTRFCRNTADQKSTTLAPSTRKTQKIISHIDSLKKNSLVAASSIRWVPTAQATGLWQRYFTVFLIFLDYILERLLYGFGFSTLPPK